MTEHNEDEMDETSKPSKKPLLVGLLLAIIGGAGGFFSVSSGLILSQPSSQPDLHQIETAPESPDVVFLAMDPIVVSLGPETPASHLKFRAQLEVPSSHSEDVNLLMPRIVDVFNTYLRAVRTSDLGEPAAITRLRAQLLRRAKIVLGEHHINDILVMEFVLN